MADKPVIPPAPTPHYPNTLTPFRHFCQRVLPAVYGDEISYYELLCKVTNYLNTTMSNVNDLNDNMQLLNEYITQLQKWIDEYFTNLDVQEEINKKLDEMAKDGSLAELLKPLVDDYIRDITLHYDEIESKLDSLLAKYGTPLVFNGTLTQINASTSVDRDRVYVLSATGQWVYHNDTAWVIGGIYNSQGISNNEIIPEMLNSKLYNYLDEWEWSNVIDWDNALVNRSDFDTYINRTQDGMTVKAVDTNPSEIFYRVVFPHVYPRGTLIEVNIPYLTPGVPLQPSIGLCEVGADPSNFEQLYQGFFFSTITQKVRLQTRIGNTTVTQDINTWQEAQGGQQDFKLKIYLSMDGKIYFGAYNWWLCPEYPDDLVPLDTNGNKIRPEQFQLGMSLHAAATNQGINNVTAKYVGDDWSKILEPGWGAVFTAPVAGNPLISIQLPDTYSKDDKSSRSPMAMLCHGNGFIYDGRPYNSGFTHREQYMPMGISQNPPDYWIITDDWRKWYKTIISDALLDAGYVCVGSTYYDDLLYGNQQCINAFTELYDYTTKLLNVFDDVYTVGASNGCMTALNGINLLGSKVRAFAGYYPLCCLYNQYLANASQRPQIQAAYGIPENTPDADVPKYLWQHDPLTSYVIDDKKSIVYPPCYISYSLNDITTVASDNAIPFIGLLENSHINYTPKLASGGHGDASHFDPAELVEFFNKYRGV